MDGLCSGDAFWYFRPWLTARGGAGGITPAVGERWQDHGPVFPSKVGPPVGPDHIDRTRHKIRATADLG
ncbi:hypothetical protein AB0K35_30910 [Micromonospora sp. NPDC053740]|uniref:hypothetical protein n=1 Tax=Micromonospora sp. NPDC053740 TaxID=3155173 RepID=UPI0034320773